MIVGAHIDTYPGSGSVIDLALDMGAEAVQTFATAPRRWRFDPPPSLAAAATFRADYAAAGLAPPFIHAIYPINLASRNPYIAERSVKSLTQHMALAAQIDAAGVIYHPGHHNGMGFDAVFRQVVGGIQRVLAQSPPGPLLCMETMYGQAPFIGNTFGELGRILRAVNSPRLGVCLDTQHAFAAGYDLSSTEGVAQTITAFDRDIGLDRLAVVHANDSGRRLGSRGHGHANIGEGLIGEQGFAAIMAHPAFADVSCFLEVPGYDDARPGPDKANVDRLKSIRRQARAGVDDE